jgi:putative endonuclease
MFYAYVLKSVSHDYFYKGHCRDLELRLQQHNSGMTESIRPYIPFQLVYFEEFETEREAILREKYFKSAAGRRFLKNKIMQ